MPMALSDVAPISFWEHGNPADSGRSFRIAILSEGFLPEEMNEFRNKSKEIADYITNIEPFSRYRDRIAVIRIECKSFASARQLAALRPAPASYTNRTPFDARFRLDLERGLRGDTRAVRGLIRSMTQMPPINAWLVLVNSYLIGGQQQDDTAWLTMFGSMTFTFVHEMAHAAFGLGDEYEELMPPPNNRPRTFRGAEPSAPNITRVTALSSIKWKDLIVPGTPLPTTETSPAGTCTFGKAIVTTFPPLSPKTVGLFEGAGRFSCGLYRPQFDCRMGADVDHFCAVCDREISRHLDHALAAAPAISIPDEDWTHVIQLAPETSTSGSAFHCAACYNAATGHFAIFYLGDLSIGSTTQRSLNHAQIDAGFTNLVAFEHNGAHFLILSSAISDQRLVYRVRPVIDGIGQTVLEELYRSADSSQTGFSHAVSYNVDGSKYLLHYDRTTGAIEIASVRVEADFVELNVEATSRAGSLAAWHAALSNITVLTIAGQPHLVGVDATGGRLYIASIGHPVGNVPMTVLTDTWFARPEFARGFQTHIAGTTLRNNRSRLIMYSTLDGRAQMFRPRRAGKGLDFEFAVQLAPGAPSMFDAGFPALGIVPSSTYVGMSAPDDFLWLYNFGLKRFQALGLK